VIYTIEGAVVAFTVGALLWPVRARKILQQKIANILEGAAVLYRAVTAAALQGADNEQQVRELDRRLHDLRRGITEAIGGSAQRTHFLAIQSGRIPESGCGRRSDSPTPRGDRRRSLDARPRAGLTSMLPSMPKLVEKTEEHFASLVQAVRNPKKSMSSDHLESAVRALDADLTRLREPRVTSPFALDRMLPFWALVFNLQEVSQDLRESESALAQIR